MSDPRTAEVREQKEELKIKRDSGQSMEFAIEITKELQLISVNV